MVDVTTLTKKDIAKLILFLDNVQVKKLKSIISKDTEESIWSALAEIKKIIKAFKEKNARMISQEAIQGLREDLRGIVLAGEDAGLVAFIQDALQVFDKISEGERKEIDVSAIAKLTDVKIAVIELFLRKIEKIQGDAFDRARQNLKRIVKAYKFYHSTQAPGVKYQQLSIITDRIVRSARKALLDIEVEINERKLKEHIAGIVKDLDDLY
jgi:hypothetical protein